MEEEEKQNLQNKKAVAISYDAEVDDAPKIIAKGEGLVAEKIIAIAKERGIEVRKDTGLAEVLNALEVDSIIPIEAYLTVAEILSYIYSKQQDYGVNNEQI